MYERCPVCDLKFEREQGYFLGAMYISYALGLLAIVGFAIVIWILTHWSINHVTLIAILVFVPLAPGLTLFSRVLWLYLDWAIDPEKPRE
jgi:hypothetical protein